MHVDILLSLTINFQVWNKVVYLDRLLQLFRYVPSEQLTIPDFVFQLSLCFRAIPSTLILFHHFILYNVSLSIYGF